MFVILLGFQLHDPCCPPQLSPFNTAMRPLWILGSFLSTSSSLWGKGEWAWETSCCFIVSLRGSKDTLPGAYVNLPWFISISLLAVDSALVAIGGACDPHLLSKGCCTQSPFYISPSPDSKNLIQARGGESHAFLPRLLTEDPKLKWRSLVSPRYFVLSLWSNVKSDGLRRRESQKKKNS